MREPFSRSVEGRAASTAVGERARWRPRWQRNSRGLSTGRRLARNCRAPTFPAGANAGDQSPVVAALPRAKGLTQTTRTSPRSGQTRGRRLRLGARGRTQATRTSPRNGQTRGRRRRLVPLPSRVLSSSPRMTPLGSERLSIPLRPWWVCTNLLAPVGSTCAPIAVWGRVGAGRSVGDACRDDSRKQISNKNTFNTNNTKRNNTRNGMLLKHTPVAGVGPTPDAAERRSGRPSGTSGDCGLRTSQRTTTSNPQLTLNQFHWQRCAPPTPTQATPAPTPAPTIRSYYGPLTFPSTTAPVNVR